MYSFPGDPSVLPLLATQEFPLFREKIPSACASLPYVLRKEEKRERQIIDQRYARRKREDGIFSNRFRRRLRSGAALALRKRKRIMNGGKGATLTPPFPSEKGQEGKVRIKISQASTPFSKANFGCCCSFFKIRSSLTAVGQ